MLTEVKVAILAVASVGGAIVGASQPGADASASSPSISTGPLTADEQYQAKVRAKFGLDNSPPQVRAARIGKDSDSTELGIPLSPAETKLMRFRDGLPVIVDKVESALTRASLKDAYGGSWIDQAGGGVVHIQLCGSLGRRDFATDVIRRTVPAAVAYVIDPVRFSATTLQGARGKIVSGIKSDATWMKWFVMDEIDDVHSLVLLVLKSDTPADVRQSVGRLFNTAVVKITYADQQIRAQSRNHLSGPVYGGEWVSGGQGAGCTSGYAHSQGGPGDTQHYYAVEAGHCGLSSGYWYQGLYAQGNRFGSAHNNGFTGHSSSYCDCVAVGPVPPSAVTASVYTSDTTLYTYGRTAVSADYKPGNRVCLSGAKYADTHGGGIICDIIKVSTADLRYIDAPYILLDGYITYSELTQPGDSGGPEGNGKAFLGIHVVKGTGSVFTGAGSAKSTHIRAVTNTTPTYP